METKEEILLKYKLDTDHFADQEYTEDGIYKAMQEYAELYHENKLKANLTGRIYAGLDRELQRQNKAGKKFISDEKIDYLVDKVIKEELGDSWKENYNPI